MKKEEEYRMELERWKAAQPREPGIFDVIRTRNPGLMLAFLTAAFRRGAAEAAAQSERVGRVRAVVLEAYKGDAAAAERFLRRPHLMLGDATPLERAVESAEGADEVINLIRRVQYVGFV